ncbi:MAG: class I SAM-dependent methyltransferase [Symbiobacteriaceae bacterium]|nr:class I SAM-dependent methyltransferase [Symbiobacteriaceae bacterium]
MTDFEKIKMYYDAKDEWARLEVPGGRLEFELTMAIVKSHLPQSAEILDLGGGPGRYTIELAKIGHTLHLADLSPKNLDVARERIAELGVGNIKSVTQVNAVNLSVYVDESFDAVLLLGPLYHLTDESERLACIKEVKRVLKPQGLVFASFIPFLSGAIGVVARMFLTPNQVDVETLNRVFNQGVFHNNTVQGFQEAYFPRSDEVVSLFSNSGFSKVLLRSIRGWGATMEEQIYKLKEENHDMYSSVMELINTTADDSSVVDMCNHAIYIGRKL